MKRILMTLTVLTLVCSMSAASIAEETSTTSSLSEAQTAYATAKQTTTLTDYEEELNSMVAAGSLTQEQADLLLTAAKETIALRNGTCPACGYQFQTTAGNRRGNSFGKGTGKMNRNSYGTSASGDTDATALQQAQEAYSTAKQNSQMTEYEAELKAMVEAGTLTQEQADLLLSSAKEAEALSNGTCPSCGYQFQTTTNTGNGKGGRMGNGMMNGNGRGGKR